MYYIYIFIFIYYFVNYTIYIYILAHWIHIDYYPCRAEANEYRSSSGSDSQLERCAGLPGARSLAKLVYNSNRVYGGYIMLWLYLYIVEHYKPTYNDAFRRVPKRGPYQLITGGTTLQDLFLLKFDSSTQLGCWDSNEHHYVHSHGY